MREPREEQTIQDKSSWQSSQSHDAPFVMWCQRRKFAKRIQIITLRRIFINSSFSRFCGLFMWDSALGDTWHWHIYRICLTKSEKFIWRTLNSKNSWVEKLLDVHLEQFSSKSKRYTTNFVALILATGIYIVGGFCSKLECLIVNLWLIIKVLIKTTIIKSESRLLKMLRIQFSGKKHRINLNASIFCAKNKTL